MDVSSHYRDAWEGFWRGTSDAPGEAMWDSDASLGSVPQAELLLSHADPALPVIDLGCGSGTQTRHLATRFARAVGVDLSAAAVEHARRADTAKAAEYEQLDLVDAVAVDALARRTGETNVYMRAVIHQSEPQDRPAVAAAVAAFLGAGGRAFVVELTPASKAALERAAQSPGGPPPKLRRVFEHGLKPAGATDEEVPTLLRAAGLRILETGDTALPMTEYFDDGSRIDLAARWFVLARE
ncbi:methyltransferase [Streptomyces sp. 150FB]|uniref:class I SAM-dependent methyltransferase n=1 Tax=Streptomyces sp. 150FB TaxID=1576605 RepID=UPI00058946D0|nr:class I SAM-dependent methyltransferase [Streptomyces sp. 150FB]KIF77644.1 methyltransferase [Streptomyces sp. 150FB]